MQRFYSARPQVWRLIRLLAIRSWLDSWQPVNIASVTRNGGVSAQVTLKDFSCTLGDCNPITPGLQSKFAGVNLKSELDSPGVSAPQAFCPVRSQSDQRISLLAGVPY